MTIYVGGLRDRLIAEAIRKTIEDSLTDLGWFSSNSIIQQPLEVITGPLENDDEINPNVISVAAEDVDPIGAELGSNLSEYRWFYAVDIFAEDGASGRHLCGDVRAILEGKFSSIGRNGPVVDVYDYTQATPSRIFSVDIENISSGKQKHYSKNYEKFWWTVAFDVVDAYGNEDDT